MCSSHPTATWPSGPGSWCPGPLSITSLPLIRNIGTAGFALHIDSQDRCPNTLHPAFQPNLSMGPTSSSFRVPFLPCFVTAPSHLTLAKTSSRHCWSLLCRALERLGWNTKEIWGFYGSLAGNAQLPQYSQTRAQKRLRPRQASFPSHWVL